MPEWLNKIDTQIFMDLNGAHSNFFDAFFILITSIEIWIPLYLLMLYVIIKKYGVKGLWIVLFFVITIILSDQLSGLLKDFVQRLRPSHEPLLAGKVHIPKGEGGLYGFVSGHAANVFSITFILGLLARNKWIFSIFFLWALLVSYSRIYVGVHYPMDIISGGILGGLIGWSIYKLLNLFDSRFQQKAIYKAGSWGKAEVVPLVFVIIFIICTILICSKIIGVYYV